MGVYVDVDGVQDIRAQTKPMVRARSNFLYNRVHDNIIELDVPSEPLASASIRPAPSSFCELELAAVRALQRCVAAVRASGKALRSPPSMRPADATPVGHHTVPCYTVLWPKLTRLAPTLSPS